MGRALGNIAGAVAPIAAGYMFPGFGTQALGGLFGSGIAAGALTGAGIAALTGDDPLMGALGGGIGGYGGGAFRGAADATKLAASGVGDGTTAGVNAVTQGSQQFVSPYTPAGSFGTQTASSALGGAGNAALPPLQGTLGSTTYQGALAPNFNVAGNIASPAPNFNAVAGGGGGYDPTLMGSLDRGIESASAAFDDTNTFFDKLGGGDVTKGYMKAGITGLPVVASALEPEYETFEDVMSEDVYDPNSQLNLNMDTSIREAMQKDSGLRLYAEGGGVTGISSSPGLPIAGATMGGGMAESVSETITAPGGFDTFESMVASGVDPANAAAMFGMDTDPYLDTGPGMTYTSPPRTSPIRGGISELPPPPSMFTPTPEFDDEYTGGYMTPSRMKSVGMEPGYSGRTRRYERLPMSTGGYLNGGTLKGDGMSDDVPAMIDGTQKAALSQGEFVVPADVVSHLGNGSSDAGSKQLYGMMDKIRKARTGTEKQGEQINPERFMPS